MITVPFLLAGCGEEAGEAGASGRDHGDGPLVVATHTILGDVVENVVGEEATVEVVMPAGVDPHEFEPSARQAARLREADLVVANGLRFEEGLSGAIDGAREDGVDVFEASAAVDPIPLPGEDGGLDPHFWTDPVRMAQAAEALAERLAATPAAIDTAALQRRAGAYAEELEALDRDIEELLAPIPADDRKLVTDHEVFGYFAERYDFEVVGAVLPGGTTSAEPSAAELVELADTIRRAGVDVVFTESTGSTDLVGALAEEADVEIDVVMLFTESLGEENSGAETYVELMRTNAERITEALAP